VLHILNGGSTEATLAQTHIAGERFSFCDVLIEGPAPANTTEHEWRKLRAAHLSSAYEVAVEEGELGLVRQEEVFGSYVDHEEVVLWFESDLFCQTNLLYVLDWFARRELQKTQLSLICIGEFPGRPNFRGIGELSPNDLASLFEKRVSVNNGVLELAGTAWQAYRSNDPRAIEQLISRDTSSLPFLKPAFRLHLERFPSIRNGLGRIENRGLELVSTGQGRFVDLFRAFIESEAGYGLGDSQFWNAMLRLTRARQPLLRSNNDDALAGSLTPEEIHATSYEITEAGRAVLSGAADYVEMNGIDLWLGGVHLTDTSTLYRWDEKDERLILS
jgi:hypothetical protein